MTVFAFKRDDDTVASNGEGVVEVFFETRNVKDSAVDIELSDEGVMDLMERLDVKGAVRASISRVKPEALKGEVGGIGGVRLGLVGESGLISRVISSASEELPDVTRCAGELTAAFEL